MDIIKKDCRTVTAVLFVYANSKTVKINDRLPYE